MGAETQLPPTDYAALVGHDRVSSRVYTDPEVYAREIERIWRRCWLYAGHASELPEPGDYLTREVALEPLLLIRGTDGEVRAFLNRCPHRGNLVCNRDRGSSKILRCDYHCWSFDSCGRLIGAPFPQAYGEGFAERDWDLRPVSRLESYRGFLFVCFDPDAASLREYLGPVVAAYLDRFVDLAPEGEVDLSAGTVRCRVAGNWKMAMENNVDPYHPAFLHRSVVASANYLVQNMRLGDRALIVPRDIGRGHSMTDYSGQNRVTGFIVNVANMPPLSDEVKAEYLRLLAARHGLEIARELIADGTSVVNVFPNLIVTWQDVRVATPVGVGESVISHTPALLRGAPKEINLARLRQQVESYGPAGCLGPDDFEMYERSQRAFAATVDETVYLGRGVGRERVDATGVVTGGPTDETAVRAFWREYRARMSGG